MSKWDEYKAARDAGQTMTDVISAGTVSRATAYRLEKRFSGATEVEDVPDGIRADGFNAKPPKPDRAPARRKTTKNAPITEETAGLILKGLSEIGAFLAAEQELALDDSEIAILEHPLTESLALLPNEMSKAVNKYAAPGVFVSQFVAIYARKMQRIAIKRAGFRPPPPANKPGAPPPPPRSASDVAAATNLEAIKAAAASVSMNGRQAPPVDGASGSGAPTQSTGVLEVEDRRTEFES